MINLTVQLKSAQAKPGWGPSAEIVCWCATMSPAVSAACGGHAIVYSYPAYKDVGVVAPRTARGAGVVLCGAYIATVLLHVILLHQAAMFPHISSDEVQYALTGENLRTGNGYTIRGKLNSGIPPVFPVMVAFAHSLPGDSRLAMLIVACIVMCAGMFPVYSLARYIGISTVPAVVLATGASVLPHTFYAGTYMAESLQYPLMLLTLYFAVRWFDSQSVRTSVALGCCLGCTLLIKVQAAQIFGAILAAVAAAALNLLRRRDGRLARRLLGHAALGLGLAGAIPSVWLLFKLAMGGSAFGIYGEALNGGLPHWSVGLTISYLADFLLAPGLVTVVPMACWFRENTNTGRAFLIGAVLLVQFGWVSAVDGGLTGLVRQRLYMYSFPIMAVLAVRGLNFLKGAWAKVAMIALPVALLTSLLRYPFYVNPLIEAPWAYLAGSLDFLGWHPFSTWRLALTAASAVAGVSAIVLVRPKSAPLVLSVFILLFNGLVFGASAVGISRASEANLRAIRPILNLLAEHGGTPGRRLLIAGRPAYFESKTASVPRDDTFLDWTWRLGLSEALGWQVETIGRYDVRMIPSPAALRTEARPGDFLLSAAAFDEPRLLGYQFPVYVYQIDGEIAGAYEPRYTAYVPAEEFSTLAGRKTQQGAIVGTGNSQMGYLVHGPGLPMTPGAYEVEFDVKGSATVTTEVVGSGGMVIAGESKSIAALKPLRFSTDGVGPLQYRIFGPSDSDFRFAGVKLRYLGATQVAKSDQARGTLRTQFLKQTQSGGVAAAGACYVDVVNGQPPRSEYRINRNEGIRIVGWAADVRAGVVPEAVFVALYPDSGPPYIARAERNHRGDVAAVFGNSVLAGSGFSMAATAEGVPAGTYRLEILQGIGKAALRCETQRTIALR